MSTSRRLPRVGFTALASFSLIASGAVGAQAAPTEPSPAKEVELNLLSINDFHGRIQAEGESAGAAVLAGAVAEYRQENANTLFVSAGDNIGASTFASASQQDTPTIDALGAAGLDLSVVGNHEFDRGFQDLQERVIPRYGMKSEAEGAEGADYALGANVYEKGTSKPALREYTIREVDGVSVGFIGTVTADTATLVSPSGIGDLTFGDQLEAANRVAEKLSDGDKKNGEADVLVLLTHDGSESTACDTIAKESTDYGQLIRNADEHIDAIISGHTHKPYHCSVPVAGTDQTRPVIQAHQYGTTLGEISLSIDASDGTVTQSDTKLVPLAAEGGSAFKPNAAVTEIVDRAVAESEEVGQQEIGAISADILRGGEPAGDDRGVESTLGNTIADVHLWATSNEDFGGAPAQIAFMNPGGLRADLLYGQNGIVTYKAAADVQPFANTLITMDMTGAQLYEVLEQQWQPEGASREKLHLGISEGLSYTYVEDAARGEHITSVSFNGKPVAESDTFRVAANAFLASGGDNFTAFAEAKDHADSGQVDLDATVNYFKSHDVVDPAPLGRAVQAGTEWATVSLSSATLAPGATLDVAVSDLEPGAKISASAFDGEVEVQDIAAADGAGSTSFQLTAPQKLKEGQYQLVISQVGREDISVPLTVAVEAPTTPSTEPSPQPSASPTASPSASPSPTQSTQSPAPPRPDASQSPAPDHQDLADTGFAYSSIGIVAAVILVVGLLMVLLRRRGNTH